MNSTVWDAMRFAIGHYESAGIGQDGNYIFPPMEMFSLLNSMNMGAVQPNVLVAGILFNTIEDTGVTLEMIREKFGDEVTGLVAELLIHLYLKQEKGAGMMEKDLKDASAEIKVLALCEVIVKQRLLIKEIAVMGNEVWRKHATPKETMCAYFSRIQDALYDLQFDSITAAAYWEMVDTFKDLFVTFYYDREEQRMIQICVSGENYVIAKSDLQGQHWIWEIPKNAVMVNRRYAERIEDNWGEEYNLQKSAAEISFEDYFVAVKEHLRGFLKEISERDLDRLAIANLDYIRTRYESDLTGLVKGETTAEIFLVESPAMTADRLERIMGVPEPVDRK